MNGGVLFKPYKLLSRTVLTEGSEDGGKRVIKLTIELEDSNSSLGFGQPTTAVKVRGPNAWFRSRPYSVASSPHMKGKFELLVKVYPKGWVSRYLDTVEIGTDLYCAKTVTKPSRPPAEVVRLGLIAYGIGISDMLHTCKLYLESGAEVRLIYAVQGRADVILTAELESLAQSFPSFYVRYQLSRDKNAASYGEQWHSGRLNENILKEFFSDWIDDPWDYNTKKRVVVDVIGTKEMVSSTNSILAKLGLAQTLIGPKGLAAWFWWAT